MSDDDIRDVLAETFHAEWPRLVAVAMRIVGDLQAAEDIVQDVLVTALDRWPLAGLPDNAPAWLMTACRNRALNALRDAGRARARELGVAQQAGAGAGAGAADGAWPGGAADQPGSADRPEIPDDRLRLIFICCHPVLPLDGQVALTLRMVGGLSTSQIARAFCVPDATIAQRIVRAKRTLAQRQVPFDEPAGPERSARLPAVLDVIYLIFNEGYLASAGQQLTSEALTSEAYRLARLLTELLPAEPDGWALRAIIALHRSREAARTDAGGRLLTMEEQDRASWDRQLIADGLAALARAEQAGQAELADPASPSGPAGWSRPVSPLVLQARLAGQHAAAASFAETDWAAIVTCYDELMSISGSAVVALNRAVAVAMASGPAAALPLLDNLTAEPALARTHRVWAVRADLRRRAGERAKAIADYDRALELVDNEVERRYLTTMRQAAAANTGGTRDGAC
jgi:RNA polymerase sigma factor (sigma-70 family)